MQGLIRFKKTMTRPLFRMIFGQFSFCRASFRLLELGLYTLNITASEPRFINNYLRFLYEQMVESCTFCLLRSNDQSLTFGSGSKLFKIIFLFFLPNHGMPSAKQCPNPIFSCSLLVCFKVNAPESVFVKISVKLRHHQ